MRLTPFLLYPGLLLACCAASCSSGKGLQSPLFEVLRPPLVKGGYLVEDDWGNWADIDRLSKAPTLSEQKVAILRLLRIGRFHYSFDTRSRAWEAMYFGLHDWEATCPTLLLWAMLEGDDEFREHVIYAVNYYNRFEEDALPVLLHCSRSADPWVRDTISNCFNKLKRDDPEIIQALLRTTEDPVLGIRFNAHSALLNLTRDARRAVRYIFTTHGTPPRQGIPEQTVRERMVTDDKRFVGQILLVRAYEMQPTDVIREWKQSLSDRDIVVRRGAAAMILALTDTILPPEVNTKQVLTALHRADFSGLLRDRRAADRDPELLTVLDQAIIALDKFRN